MEQQVSAEDVIYPQIFSDFVSGINLMGTERGKGDGHANKFAAEAFLARAYMFWAGFYKNAGELAKADATVELIEQEGCKAHTLNKAEVVAALKDVVANGGYQLCEDFRSLWQYSNSLLWEEAQDGGGIVEIKDIKDDKGNIVGKDTVRTGHTYAFIKDMDRRTASTSQVWVTETPRKSSRFSS